MEAIAIKNTIPVLFHAKIEGQFILETDCRDYDHFASLPNTVSFENRVYCKTGWNSDYNKACYKTNVPYARAI